MWRFDWHFTPDVSSCPEARRLQTYVKEAIAPQLTDATTQEQFDAVMAALKRYKDDLLKQKKTFHFPAGHGRHYCIEDAFAFLMENLTAQWLLKPQPIPEPEPPVPPPKPRSLKDVLKDFAARNEADKPNGE